jgi:ATP-binding cassette subfamily F protein uup
MNYLSVENLTKSFGDRLLFADLTFGIDQGQKVAIVAKNGSGKTTLFKILKGIEIADEGEVVFRKNISVAFLDQNFSLDQQQTIQQLIENADNPYVKCIKAYEHAVQLSVDEPGDKSAQLMDEALNQMNELNAWEYETNLKEILSRLELNDLSQTIHTLSGGQQKRVALALVLINKPDLVIMDEPTNHLDIDMIEWLEHYLQNASLSLLLVTHNSIIELERGEIVEYKGNFEYYLTKKAEREAIKAAEIDKAKNLYKRELEWVRKMPKARTTKSKSRVDAFYDIEEKAKQKRVDKKIELSVKMERLGSKIVELIKVSKAFGNKVILNPFTYTFMNGEKIGVVGKNGMGKSTLLKIILNELQPDSGKVQIGDTVVFGYYSQTGMQLAEDKRIIEVVKDIAEFIPLANGTSLSASALLTRFNFPPDVQYSYVSKLSGGEKRRLYLLTVLVKNPNFLILDEPTNDLDIVTLQTLEEFLDEFKGCVLIVSHDRYFMDRLVDHVFAFEGNGEIKDYPGTYTEYRIWKQEQQAVQKAEESKLQAAIAEKKEEVLLQPETNNSQKKRSYKLQKELDDLEKEIPQLEAKKKEIEAALTSTNEFERIQQLTAEFEKVNALLDEKSLRWLEIQEQ